MTIEELKFHGAIYVPNIIEGITRYKNSTIRLNEPEALKTFRGLLRQNGPKHSFADFYYYRLDVPAKEKIGPLLTDRESAWLNRCFPSYDDIIFPLDDTLLAIIVRLNAAGMLFSTLYFTLEKSTWWGNFDQEYIVLRE